MVGWFFAAGLTILSVVLGYALYQEEQRPAPVVHTAETKPQLACQKFHCECQKGETPTEMPDDEAQPSQDGGGS